MRKLTVGHRRAAAAAAISIVDGIGRLEVSNLPASRFSRTYMMNQYNNRQDLVSSAPRIRAFIQVQYPFPAKSFGSKKVFVSFGSKRFSDLDLS